MLVMFRIFTPLWEREDSFKELLAFFKRAPGMVDELAFMSYPTVVPPPLAQVRQYAMRLKTALARARMELRVRAGINVIATMGQRGENMEASLDEKWPRVVGADGAVCRGCFCPGDPDFLEYVRELYALTARAEPDFIWIDDDPRLNHHEPARWLCFCEECLERFARETSRRFTRESLVAALNAGTDDARQLRRAWLDHNRELLNNFYRVIQEAVRSVTPGLPIGGMLADCFYEGYDLAGRVAALAGPQKAPVLWRPGGGFWNDDVPMQLVGKAHAIGRQVAALPAQVQVIQSEIEAWPYQLPNKSVHITMTEAAADMAAGTTGTAFNVLAYDYRPNLDEYAPWLDAVKAARPFFQALHSALGRRECRGVYPAWNRDLFLANGTARDWFGEPGVYSVLQAQYALGEIGMPLCYHPQGACATTLAGSIPNTFSDEALELIFRGGVFLDAEALQCLQARGLAKWTGARVSGNIERDAIEVFTDHPFNGTFAGWHRDARQAYHPQAAWRVEPDAPGAQVLGRMIDYRERELGACMTCYENELGGRVVVSGYYPWRFIHFLAKSSQLKRVFTWLSRDTLPVVVESLARMVVWARGESDGPLHAVLLNASLDPARNVRLRVRARAATGRVLFMDGATATIRMEEDAGPASGYRRAVLPDLAPWSICLVEA